MHFTKSILLSLVAFTATSFAAPVQSNNVEARAPHPFEIASPASGATVCGSFSFTALDGEQDSQYYVQALLRNNETGHESVIVKTTRFDGYEVTAEVDVKKFPKGAYQLIAKESDAAGKVNERLAQPITID